MAFRITARFDGLEPLIRKLSVFRASTRRKVLRSAMRKSASVVNKAAKARAPQGPPLPGQLKRSLGVKVKAYRSGIVIGIVEPRPGFRVLVPRSAGNLVAVKPHNPRIIAHLVEHGTTSRRQKGGRYTGAARPKPFLAPALQSSSGRIVGIFMEEIAKEMAKL